VGQASSARCSFVPNGNGRKALNEKIGATSDARVPLKVDDASLQQPLAGAEELI
jgi:hypothetical protein